MSQKRTLAEADGSLPPCSVRPHLNQRRASLLHTFTCIQSSVGVGAASNLSGPCSKWWCLTQCGGHRVCDAMLAEESAARRTTTTPSKRLSTLFRLMHASSGLRGLKLIAEETNRELMEERDEADTRKQMQDGMQSNWKHLPDTLRYCRTLGQT
jgi:hypothetical protein